MTHQGVQNESDIKEYILEWLVNIYGLLTVFGEKKKFLSLEL